MTDAMQKHYVTFYSPGTIVPETDTHEVDSWNVNAAVEMSYEINQRHGARPYGFRFTTRERGPDDFDSKVTATSGTYYLGGEVMTLEQVRAKKRSGDATLITNMKINNIERVIENCNSWRSVTEFKDGDVVLQYDVSRLKGPT